MKKKFAIDCSKLNILEKSGTHRFLIGFLNKLTKNKEFEYYFFYKEFSPELNNFDFLKRGKVVETKNKFLYTQLQILRNLNDYDYFLFPWQTLPFLAFSSKACKLAIVHDTGFSFKTKVFTFLTQLCADKLFSVSAYTASKMFKSSVVINEGVDEDIFYKLSGEDLAKLKKEFDIPNYFILSLGRLESRKNYENNLVAFSKIQKFFPKLKYVFIGQIIDGEEYIYSLIDNLKIDRERILFKKYISDKELNVYLNCMELMVFTPKEEGFGLPVLESYVLGKPVILSRIQALADFKLSANQIVDFDDIEGIAFAITSFLTKKELNIYPKQYKQVLSIFNWKNSAKNFINNI